MDLRFGDSRIRCKSEGFAGIKSIPPGRALILYIVPYNLAPVCNLCAFLQCHVVDVPLQKLRLVSSTPCYRSPTSLPIQGHTHNDLDQRFSIVGTALARKEIIETPDDFASTIYQLCGLCWDHLPIVRTPGPPSWPKTLCRPILGPCRGPQASSDLWAGFGLYPWLPNLLRTPCGPTWALPGDHCAHRTGLSCCRSYEDMVAIIQAAAEKNCREVKVALHSRMPSSKMNHAPPPSNQKHVFVVSTKATSKEEDATNEKKEKGKERKGKDRNGK